MSSTNFIGNKLTTPQRLRAIANAPYRDPDALRWIADTLETSFANVHAAVKAVDDVTPHTHQLEQLIAVVAKELR